MICIVLFLVMTIFQYIKNVVSRLQLKTAMILRGETFTTTEASLAFNIQQSPKQTFLLKNHQYPQLTAFILGFLNSAAINGNISGENLAFVIGAEGIGKSTQIQSVLTQFKRLKADKRGNNSPEVHKYTSPESHDWMTRTKQYDNQHYILINHDYSDNPALNFEEFIHSLHQDMIEKLIKLDKRIGNKVLSPSVIRDVLLSESAQQHLFVYLKDVIFGIINGCDPLFLGQSHTNELISFNEQMVKLQAYQFFNGDLYHRLVDLLSQGLGMSATEACIRMFVSVGKRIQYEHRDQVYTSSWFSSGIQSTNVLLDLLNFVCGLGSLNKGIAQAYFAEGIAPPPTDNWVLSGNRADVALCLINLEQLYIWDSPQLWNFLDHIISRTAVAHGLRKHFPVIIQLPSAADVEDILSTGQFQLGTAPMIQVPGYLHHTLTKSGLSKIVPPKIVKRLFYSLGKSPAVWSSAIQQLAKGTKFNDLISGKAAFIEKDGIRAQAKFNRVFTTLQAQQALYDRTAIPELIQYLRLLRKARGMAVVDRPGYYIDYVTRPLFQALMREGLIYHSFYLPHLDCSRLSYFPSLMLMKNSLLRKHFWSFMRWRYESRDRFSLYGPQVKYKDRFESDAVKFDRFLTKRSEYQLTETYYGGMYNYTFQYAKYGTETTIA